VNQAGELALGTRGSELALVQARMVASAINEASPNCAVRMVVIKTLGDEHSSLPAADLHAGRKGMFTREIERALLDSRIDAAVHSAKDLPSEMDPELTIAAVLPRAEIEDVIVTKSDVELATLPANVTIATGSVRRRFQLGAIRSDIEIADLRGNVPTRLRKLAESDWAGIVLARAGLSRLGFPIGRFDFEGALLVSTPLSIDQFVPAGGQGVIAIQTRAEDSGTHAVISAIDHRETHLCLLAEREFLRLLQADCNSPVGVHASITNEMMSMTAQLFEPVLRQMTATRDLSTGVSVEIATELFAKLNG